MLSGMSVSSSLRLALLVFVVLAAAGTRADDGAVIAGDDFWCNLVFEKLTMHPVVAKMADGQVSEAPSEVVAVAPGLGGSVLGLARDFRFVEFASDGTTRQFGAPRPNDTAFALTVARNGDLIALGYAGARMTVYVFSPDGVLRAAHNVNSVNVGFREENWSIDLAADQCTVHFVGSAAIHSFDICSGVDGPTLPLPYAYAVRVLPNRNLLVASISAFEPIHEIDHDGVVVRSWPGTEKLRDSFRTALMLVDGGRRAWYSKGSTHGVCGSEIFEVDLETGSIRTVSVLDLDSPTSIAPANAWTAALATKRRRAVR